MDAKEIKTKKYYDGDGVDITQQCELKHTKKGNRLVV